LSKPSNCSSMAR